MVTALSQLLDALRTKVVADRVELLSELDREGKSDIAQADDSDDCIFH